MIEFQEIKTVSDFRPGQVLMCRETIHCYKDSNLRQWIGKSMDTGEIVIVLRVTTSAITDGIAKSMSRLALRYGPSLGGCLIEMFGKGQIFWTDFYDFRADDYRGNYFPLIVWNPDTTVT